MSERAAPFYCPYCGEETLRPFGELDDPHGQWQCDSCRRAFRLRMMGLTRGGRADGSADAGSPGDADSPGDAGGPDVPRSGDG